MKDQIKTIALAVVIVCAMLAASAFATFNGQETAPAPAVAHIKAVTPWGIDWGIGAACYKVSALNAAISCVKVSPEELELFKKTLEAQRSN